MATGVLPATMRKLVVTKLTNSFKDAVQIQTCSLPKLSSDQVLVKNRYVGINASDINFTAGKYMPGVPPPFDAGFEAVGEVVAVGNEVPRSMLGQNVIYAKLGSFAEYFAVSVKEVFVIKELKPEYLPFVVLVTAAAGGTGQFAVQLAKLAGCHVIGTCSTQEKADFLKSIGCDHPIVTSKENLNDVLKKSYPDGVDVVYESVGGETYDVCINRLAARGRLIVIGFISQYKEAAENLKPTESYKSVPEQLLVKNAGVQGFFLGFFKDRMKASFENLTELYESGKLKSTVDLGLKIREGGFKGIDSINDAVEFLYSRKSVGKVVVDLRQD